MTVRARQKKYIFNMFKRGCGLEFLLILCGLELSWSCPHHCICYTAPSTVSCQAHNFLTVPEGIPAHSERIFLQNNKIQQLLRGHFTANTAMLWLYSNNISYIQPSTFSGFTQLEELDLGDNRHLGSLAPDTFHGLSRLHALHLYRCGLSSLPTGIFQGLHNLQYLYLQENQLEFLEDDLFVDLLNLSHLFLHGNRLWSLHQNTFRGLGGLDRLLLHHNRLQWVHQLAFHDLRRLTTLFLFNNSLTELAGECLAQLPALEYLRLNDNPWECDCKALSLWDWLQRFRGSTSSLGCQAPPELAGKDMKRLLKEDFPSCGGSESLHQSKGGAWPGSDKVSLKKEHHPRPHPHHPHLPHHDQHYPFTPSPLPRPPPPSAEEEDGAAPPLRPHRPRNCTRQRIRGGKGKGPNDVHGDKEYSLDFGPGGKYDPSVPGSSPPRRKHKCGPRPSVRPPSGVKQADSSSRATLLSPLLLLYTCTALPFLLPLAADILR
ncbi:reticulon-4 receptor-like 1 [Conger conger]|uniref:reticulon-4 receptor-like 1 n=1 Tax=Conger conger TaxID=82655 RepID=UPI002A598B64|nr:reticulon-4 receptor-like 1 [Conger conger]